MGFKFVLATGYKHKFIEDYFLNLEIKLKIILN